MSLTIEQLFALPKAYPQIVKNVGGVAYDIDGNKVVYELAVLNAKVTELQTAEVAAQEATATAKQTGIAKLAKLGLTDAEIKALTGN